jgi:hypothetical protein
MEKSVTARLDARSPAPHLPLATAAAAFAMQVPRYGAQRFGFVAGAAKTSTWQEMVPNIETSK